MTHKAEFISIENIEPDVFQTMIDMVKDKYPAQLHMLHEITIDRYQISIIEFIDHLIHVGEYLEQYETCTMLVKQRTSYLNWLNGNRTTITVMKDIINEFKDKV